MKPPEPIIRLEDAHKSWRAGESRIDVLRGIDLEARAGESVAIMGPSGCGKSTLLHVLGLLTPLDQGAIYFRGKCVASASQWWDRDVRRSIGFVFQDSKLIPNLTVLENVCVPLAHRGVWPARQKKAARAALAQVGLDRRVGHYPRLLSSGELIRAALARALVIDSTVLLCDEPTGSLDSKTGDVITDLLLGTVGPDRALIMVTHNPALAQRADRMLNMKDGRLLDGNGG